MAGKNGPARDTFKKGDSVYFFYRMRKCPPARKYMAVLDPAHGAWRPRTGMSDGWVPAKVVEDSDGSGQVKVLSEWRYFYTMRGQTDMNHDEYADYYDEQDVKYAPSNPAGGLLPLVFPNSQPELAIISFRWGGHNEVIAPQQWGETGSSVSDVFVNAFLDSAVYQHLGNNFEVWTVYIETATDLNKVADAAHLIFSSSHPARRAKHVCAMYFLYPTGFEESCVPTRETGEDGGAALVDQAALFRTIKAMERAGIPTRFPHCSGFYELLTSKRWTSLMATTPHLRVPPTIALPRMLVEQCDDHGASRALSALREVRKKRAELAGEAAIDTDKGVAKLGFSWEALDVKFWKGEDGLKEALHQLTQVIEISGELTGQPHDLESIIVQDYCEHDLELRLYVVEGKVETRIYTKFCKIKENNEFGDFHEVFTQEEAVNWMDGDMAALRDGERQCEKVTAHWLSWVRSQVCDMPPAIRFDYFVGRKPGKRGEAVVWTLEICELGFSMLGAEDLPSKVFAAMLRSCLGQSALDFSAAASKNSQKEKQPEKQPTAQSPKPSPKAQAEATRKDKKAAEVEVTSNSAKEAVEDGASVAKVIYVKVPEGGPPCNPHKWTEDQVMCSGKYELLPEKANGMPLWKHEAEERWLYKGTDQNWYIGDEEEQEANFNAFQGYIRHAIADRGMHLPHMLHGPWQRGEDWDEDPRITVSLSESAGPVIAEGNGKPKGKKNGRKKR